MKGSGVALGRVSGGGEGGLSAATCPSCSSYALQASVFAICVKKKDNLSKQLQVRLQCDVC